jgi:hypothetical protein
MCKAKIFSGSNTPGPPLKGKGRGAKERDEGVEKGKDWGEEGEGENGRAGKGRGRLGGEKRKVQREERRGGNERRKVGWGGILLHALRRIDATDDNYVS